MRRLLILATASACAPSIADSSDSGGPSTGQTSTSVGTANLEGTSEPTASETSGDTTTGADEESGNEFPGDGSVSIDVGNRPEIELCESSDAQQIDLAIVGPDGAVATAYGWWGWDSCCINDPWLVLTDAPQLEVTNGQITTPHLAIYVGGDWKQSGPYLGPLPIWFALPGDDVTHETGFELIEPLDPQLSDQDEQPPFSGTFAIENAGWSAQGSAVVPHCKALDTPPCPCE